MITMIGITAGEIWDYLDRSDEAARMQDIIGELAKDRDIIMMSLGWLAREGHIRLEKDDTDYSIKLARPREAE